MEKLYYGPGEIDFFDIFEQIIIRDDMKFCDDTKERTMLYRSICVYKDNEFVGKIRFTDDTGQFLPQIDSTVVEALKK